VTTSRCESYRWRRRFTNERVRLNNFFIPYVISQLQSAQIIDIIWDTYKDGLNSGWSAAPCGTVGENPSSCSANVLAALTTFPLRLPLLRQFSNCSRFNWPERAERTLLNFICSCLSCAFFVRLYLGVPARLIFHAIKIGRSARAGKATAMENCL
jgi:hypothetical protein